MKAMVVGADRLGNIPAALEAKGINIMWHVSGRAAAEQRRPSSLPTGTQLVILFTDFLGHNAMRGMRRAAHDQGIPVVACRRSITALLQSLQRLPALNG